MLTNFYRFRIPSLPKKNKHSTSEPPLPHRNTIVSSKYDIPMCEPKGGNHKSLTPDQSADDDRKDQQDDKEAQMADEEEELGGDREQNTPPVSYSTTKQPLSTMGEKAHMKRPLKRRHLSSPFLAESQAPPQADFYDECRTVRLNIGSLNSIANTPCLLESSQGQLYPTLHEGEEWEIARILGKRRIGKSYEYRVRWRSTWLPKSALGNAQALLRDFEARSRAQRGRKRGKGLRTEEQVSIDV